MHVKSHQTFRRVIVMLALVSVALRACVAHGYMLSMAPNGLRVVPCDGPVSLHSTGHGHDQHLELQSHPGCAYWSASATGLLLPDVPSLTPTLISAEPVFYQSLRLAASVPRHHGIRAPPTFC